MDLGAIPSLLYCSSQGVDIAYLLFLHKNNVWHRKVAAKFMAEWKSPSEAAPSPKYVTATRSSLAVRKAYPAPEACGTCVAILFKDYLMAMIL
jgi:hypothetical protein